MKGIINVKLIILTMLSILDLDFWLSMLFMIFTKCSSFLTALFLISASLSNILEAYSSVSMILFSISVSLSMKCSSTWSASHPLTWSSVCMLLLAMLPLWPRRLCLLYSTWHVLHLDCFALKSNAGLLTLHMVHIFSMPNDSPVRRTVRQIIRIPVANDQLRAAGRDIPRMG